MTEKVKMPRRPAGRPKAKEADEFDDMPELLRLDERACILLCVEYDEQKAAIEMGWPLAQVKALLKEERTKQFLTRADDHFFKEYAKSRVRHLLKVGVTKANIEDRLMQLAMMDPAHTKGSIEGQVKALSTLADKFGYGKDQDPVGKMTPDEQKALIERANRRLIEGKVDTPVN